MSLRNDHGYGATRTSTSSQRNARASRASGVRRRDQNRTLERACDAALASARAFEGLEARYLMAAPTPLHYYPFSEGSGTTTADAAGTNNGTLVSTTLNDGSEAVTWGDPANASPAGGAYLHFEAEPSADVDTYLNNGGRVDTDSPLNTDLVASGTVSAWIRITPPTAPEDPIGGNAATVWRSPAITGVEQGGGSNDVFYGWVGNDGRAGVAAGNGASARTRSSIVDGTWHLLTVTRDVNGPVRTYLDGRLQSTATSETGRKTMPFGSIGALTDVDADGNIVGYNSFNNTDLDDVRIYNRVLTDAEVLSLVPESTAAPAAPTAGTATLDPNNARLITLTFTDNADNESGFIIERAILGPDGVLGAFTEVGQMGVNTGTAPLSFSNVVDRINTDYVFRVRAYNQTGASANATFAPVRSGTTVPNAVSAGYLNSNFWGAQGRIYPTDPDAATNGIALNPPVPPPADAAGDPYPDPADPTGIAVRNPDVYDFPAGTADAAQDNAIVLSRDYGNNSPNGAIRSDNYSTIWTGKIIIPADANGDGVEGGTVSSEFRGFTDDDGHLYVNGQLVSTDPVGHGRRDATNYKRITLTEGQAYDFVLLQAEGTGGSGIGVKWTFYDDSGNAVGVPNMFIPYTNLEAGPSVPAKPTLAVTGTPGAHQVSFSIAETSGSEQRWELERREPGGQWAKVNEAGINATFINDASAKPNTTYEYRLVGFNFASGYGERSEVVTATTAPEAAPADGLHAYYYNDDFWGQGENRPLPRLNNLYVGFGNTVNSADQATTVPQVNFNYNPTGVPGDYTTERDPSKGSPSPLIRDNSFSTVFTGKLVVTEAGSYRILGFTDDDGYVIVDNVIVSSDPNGHGMRDPRVTPNTADRFTNPITLEPGEHDIVVLQSEQGGGAGVQLQWITPSMTAANPNAAPVVVPSGNLRTTTPVPAQQGTPTITESRGTNAVFSWADNSTSELKQVLEIATDADFTQNVRQVPVGINVTSIRVFGLTPGQQYYARVRAINFEGESVSAGGAVNPGSEQVPAAPDQLAARVLSPTSIRLTWRDNSLDETGFVIQRRRQGEADFVDVGTVGVNATNFTDTLDPAAFPMGSTIEYRVASVNNAGRSPSAVLPVTVGGAGGTGLRQTIYEDIDTSSTNGVPCFEPNVSPTLNQVDPIVDDNYGTGQPDPAIQGIDTFGIEWNGEVQAEKTEAYDFSVAADDGVRLWINDELVIDAWRNQGETEYFTGNYNLTAGQRVRVRMQYYENGGGAVARLRWTGTSTAKEAIPTSFLFPAAADAPTVAAADTRLATKPEAFGLCPPTDTVTPVPEIAVRWQDNAFGEKGYIIERSTSADSGFVAIPGPADGAPTAPCGSNLYIDRGSLDAEGNLLPLDPDTTYYYRIRTVGMDGTPSATASPVVSARASTVTGDFSVTSFPTRQGMTFNGYTQTTGTNRLRLTNNQNNQVGSAYFNRSFDVTRDFKTTFDFQDLAGGTADGFTFVMQNVATDANPYGALRALGGGGGGLGYSGIGAQSAAVKFDVFNNIDHTGLYTQGTMNDLVQPNTPQPVETDMGIDVRPNTIDFNGGRAYRVELTYNATTHILTEKITDIGTPANVFTTSYEVDLASLIGNCALFGFTAATGGANVRQEILNFNYDVAEPPGPTATIGDVTLAEGNAGTTDAVFTVTLSGPASAPVTFQYATSNGTATAGSDYTAATGTLTIPAGQTTGTITVPVAGDTTVEPDETFTVTLSAPTGATLADGTATGTITNDDVAPPVTLSIGDVTVAEGNLGTSNATFTVTLSAPSATDVTVDYATADGTATAGADYAATTGTLTIPAGSTTATFTVPVNGDVLFEPDETFLVNIANATGGATLADAQATGTITNDDVEVLPTLSVDDVTIAEGNAGNPNAAFTVTLSRASLVPVTVNYATSDGTATANGDYLAQAGTLTFAPGETSKTINVPVVGDAEVEPDETFTVTLSAPLGATLADASGTGTITNDDAAPTGGPRVVQVFVGGPQLTGPNPTAGQQGFRAAAGTQGDLGFLIPAGNDQVRALPWLGGINQIAVRFDRDVPGSVQLFDLIVRGVNRPQYTVTGFTYNNGDRLGIWTLDQAVTNDKLQIEIKDHDDGTTGINDLDGEWTNPDPRATPPVVGSSYPSGDGVAGGDFKFRINVLAGDATGDGRVNALDLSFIKQRQNRSAANPGAGASTYSVFADLDGNGTINALDLSAAKQRQNRALPGGEPQATGLLFSSKRILA